MSELTHMNRVATAGELSASIAHEVNQPITGIVLKASAALRLLPEGLPNAQKVRDILTDIVSAGQRAGEIVTSVRAMFKGKMNARKRSISTRRSEIVLALLKKRPPNPPVSASKSSSMNSFLRLTGDPVQLQQLILNLDGQRRRCYADGPTRESSKSSIEPQRVRHSSCLDRRQRNRASAPSDLNRIFDPMFTTKSKWHGHGAFDLPHDHREPRRQNLGVGRGRAGHHL